MKALQDESTASFKSMVDLGSDFYVQAVVCVAAPLQPSLSRVRTRRWAPAFSGAL